MTVFDACKTISAKDAAAKAGLQTRQKGKKHWTNCFLHDDKTASLALYDDNGGWYCFSCHAGGDAVKLYELLYNLTAKDAAQKLSADFSLSAPVQGYQAAPRKILTARDLNRSVGDIRWRRISQLLDIKYKALDRIKQIQQDTPQDLDKVDAEIAKCGAAQDLINRIDLLTGADLLAWVEKGGKLDDL